MNRISQCSRWLWIPLLCCCMCFTFGGCKEESAGRSSLHVSMERRSGAEKTLLPNDTPLEVSRYVVEGTGPQDTTFSVMSNTSTVDVDGLLIGTWDITAVGRNDQGVDLVTGSVSVNLSKDPLETVITLDALSGNGMMDIHLGWDASKINSPSLEVWLTDPQGTSTSLTPTTNNMENGSVVFNGSYPAGSYLLRAKLYSGTTAVAGCAEVIRVVGNKTTEGVIELTLDKYADIPATITLVNNLGVPVECSIQGIREVMEAQVPATATLSAQEATDLEVSWYLDGEEISNALSCAFTPESGLHRLDVIAKGALLASTGSASITFKAAVEGTAGVPKLVGMVEDTTDGLYVGKNAHVAFLPDGKLVLASNQHQTIQVCRIVRDTLEVVNTYTTTDGFNAVQVTDIYVDPLTKLVAIADASIPSLSVYFYDSKNATLTKQFERNNTYYKTSSSSKTFTSLHQLSKEATTGILYGLIPDASHVVQTNLYAQTPESADPGEYIWWFSNPPVFDALAISEGSQSAALADTDTGFLKLCRKNPMDDLFAQDQHFQSTDTPYLDNIGSLHFINDEQLIYATDNDIGRFAYASNAWTQKEVYTSSQNDIGAMEGISQLVSNKDDTMLYVLAKDSKNVVSFSVDGFGRPLFLENSSLGDYAPARMTLSPSEEHLAIVSDMNDSLILCAIP
ncbi:hypothetical protein [uncultured Sphaerochaeta sp.]|uniref:hypothetical protein n=1 Tax=uncultured Sphaerochaeta sp. TaxID=886478 RepID=UPI002A0A945B|nr:hypothetical protein [uncultured Sphaerochaeta sp.]